MVSAEDVIRIYQSLLASDIQVWVTGGWGIDALICQQTRPHNDLDIIIPLDDVVRMRELMARDGYRLKKLWSENSWVVNSHGTETPTAFVLQDSDGRELDVHAVRLDDRGNAIPAWTDDEGLVFTWEDLAGKGVIAGLAVQCLSPEMQLLCHSGYEIPDFQLADLELLRKKFGVEYPSEHRGQRQCRA
jgi:lincosamide nucleotidyltransferase A/C/D/E